MLSFVIMHILDSHFSVSKALDKFEPDATTQLYQQNALKVAEALGDIFRSIIVQRQGDQVMDHVGTISLASRALKDWAITNLHIPEDSQHKLAEGYLVNQALYRTGSEGNAIELPVTLKRVFDLFQRMLRTRVSLDELPAGDENPEIKALVEKHLPDCIPDARRESEFHDCCH